MRPRLFDAAVEEPDLLDADRRERRARRHAATAAAIDPRIAARRALVQAEEAEASSRGSRRLSVVAIVAVVLAVAGAGVLLSPLMSVRTLEVVGADRTSATAVRAASGLASGPPMVRIDQARVRSRIAALPWVGVVRLQRRWPSTVVVTVEERHPVAVAPCQAGAASSCLVDASGRVLAAATSAPTIAAGLPRLAGTPPAGEPGTMLPGSARGPLAVAVALPDALRPLVLGVRGDGIEVTLDLRAPGRDVSPPVVRLGAANRIPDKLTAAATVLARTSVNGVAVLDVRVPESPALTRVRG